VFAKLRQFGDLSGELRKPVVSQHAQIPGPVRGVTNHENSANMSLYGYNLA
jgi:hypothetical protein